jgi:hypothetical protein
MSADAVRAGATTDARSLWAGRTWRFGPAVLGLLAGWVALFAWTGMVTRHTYLFTVLAIGLLMTLAGVALRAFRVAPYAVAAAQLVVGLLGLEVMAAHAQAFLGVVPTVASVRGTVFAVVNGAATLNQYSSPVQVNPRSTTAMLTACGARRSPPCRCWSPSACRSASCATPWRCRSSC